VGCAGKAMYCKSETAVFGGKRRRGVRKGQRLPDPLPEALDAPACMEFEIVRWETLQQSRWLCSHSACGLCAASVKPPSVEASDGVVSQWLRACRARRPRLWTPLHAFHYSVRCLEASLRSRARRGHGGGGEYGLGRLCAASVKLSALEQWRCMPVECSYACANLAAWMNVIG
jgi:hypothetical protein